MQNNFKDIHDRDACKSAIAQWVCSLMTAGLMSPTQLAVSLTEAYQEEHGGKGFDHDRQRLFKSSVSKWSKGVQSPSLANCRLLERVRLLTEEEFRDSNGPDWIAQQLALKPLGEVGILELRRLLDSFPRGGKSKSPPLEHDLNSHTQVLDANMKALMHLIQRSMDQDVSENSVPMTFQEKALEGHFRRVLEKDEGEMEKLKLRLGEMVLSMFLGQEVEERGL